jgi:hypothetical protein
VTPVIRQASGLQWALPIPPGVLPKPESAAGKLGLTYQRRVGKALSLVAAKIGASLTTEPWFRFQDNLGLGQIVPDFVFETGDLTLIIEVKFTFVPEGLEKLHGLYLPVVKLTTCGRVRGLLICRNLTPAAIQDSHCIIRNFGMILSPARGEAASGLHILQYLGQGPIPF